MVTTVNFRYINLWLNKFTRMKNFASLGFYSLSEAISNGLLIILLSCFVIYLYKCILMDL